MIKLYIYIYIHYTQMVFLYNIEYNTSIDKSTGLPYPYIGSPIPESILSFMDTPDNMQYWRDEDFLRLILGDQIIDDDDDNTDTDGVHEVSVQHFINGIPSYDEIEKNFITELFDPKKRYKFPRMVYLIKIEEDESEAISLDPIELVEPVTPVTPVTPIEPVKSDVRTLADIKIGKKTLKRIMKELHCNNLDETKEMLKKYQIDYSFQLYNGYVTSSDKYYWSREDHEAFLSALNYFAESENDYSISHQYRP